MNMIKRTIKPIVIKSIKTRPVTLITGARQVGKSTLCRELVEEMGFNYVSLDNHLERQSALNDPELFLKTHPFPLIIDEIQYAPVLFDVIEGIVNKKKFDGGNNYGMYVLTSSKSFSMMNGIHDSLAGRIRIIHMSTLSSKEVNNVLEIPFQIDNKMLFNNIDELLLKGMYPKLHNHTELEIKEFYSNYISTYLDLEVSLSKSKQETFIKFMSLLAMQTGKELDVYELAKIMNISIEVIQTWINQLVSSDIIHLLSPYNEITIPNDYAKKEKIYFSDTGLAYYLASNINIQQLKKTYIVNEVIKSYRNNGKKARFYYYKDKNQNEIDLIILDSGTLQCIKYNEDKLSNINAVKVFKALDKTQYQRGLDCIVCNTDVIYTINENTYALPIGCI